MFSNHARDRHADRPNINRRSRLVRALLLTASMLAVGTLGHGTIGNATTSTTSAPAVTIEGASPAETAIIENAVDTYANHGLELPDLTVTVYQQGECPTRRGRYVPGEHDHDVDHVILCFVNESLVLHELAHAWENHTWDDADRDAYADKVGADNWFSAASAHKHRGGEILAVAVSYGLLSTPFNNGGDRVKLERFEQATGFTAPRAELADSTPSTTVSVVNAQRAADDAARAAAMRAAATGN